NSGVADAHNLAWKLACVLRGHAAQTLLDTYSDERRAATLDIFRQSAKSTRFMTPDTPGDAVMRDAVLALAVRHEFVRALIDPRQSVPYEYLASALNSFPARACEFSGGVPNGAPLRNMRVRGAGPGRFLLDWLGDEFTVLLFVAGALSSADEAGLREIVCEASGLRALVIASATDSHEASAPHPRINYLHDTHDAARRFYDASRGAAYLVRPDGHVCARWRRLQPDEVLRALRCALSIEAPPQPGSPVAAQESALERAYRALVAGLDAEGAAHRADYLARVVLLLVHELGAAQPALDAIEAARTPSLIEGDVTAPEDPRNERTARSAS
ncbi:MAG: FAD-dependent monooxygenase, partial [Steroidobacteraceae bacterium]